MAGWTSTISILYLFVGCLIGYLAGQARNNIRLLRDMDRRLRRIEKSVMPQSPEEHNAHY